MAEKLEFDLLVKQNDLSKSLKDAANQAQSVSSKISEGIKPLSDLNNQIEKTSTLTNKASDFMSQFRVQTLGVAAGQFVFSAISTAINFVTSSLTESISAFSESEDAINKLNQALNLTGSYSANTSEEVQNYAKQMQATSKYGDEAVLSQFNFAKSLGLTTEQAKQLTTASINLSAQLGFSLEESTSKLAKTLSGDLPRGLKNLIPELKTLTQEQLRNGEAADIINKKYGGSASAELKTYSGSVANLKNSYNDLQEKVGELIVRNSIYQGSLNTLKSFIEGLNNTSDAYSVKVLGMAGANAIGSRTSTLLKDDIAKLDKEISSLKESIKKEGDFTVIDPLEEAQQSATIARLTIKLNQFVKSREEIQRQISKGLVAKPTAEVATNIGLTPEQEEALNKAKQKTINIQEQIVLEKKKIRDEEVISIITEEEGRREAEIASILEFETKKAELDATLKEAEISKKITHQERIAEILKIGAEKELAIVQANGKSQAALDEDRTKKEKATKEGMLNLEKSYANSKGIIIGQGFALAATLAKDGSKTQFAIQKAAALAEIIIADGKARALIPAQTAMIPFPANLAAIASMNGYVTAQTALGSSIVLASAIKGFEQGGFVGGMAGASLGADNRVAQVRDGEMILNASQQKNLMDMLNSGGGSGGDVVIQVDGIEIARAVRTQMNKGFRLV